jgi:hypothetical protein
VITRPYWFCTACWIGYTAKRVPFDGVCTSCHRATDFIVKRRTFDPPHLTAKLKDLKLDAFGVMPEREISR